MSLIDIRKLNAEIDTLIAKQKNEIADMNKQREKNYEEMFDEMVRDLSEMWAVAIEVKEDMWVETDIKSHYGSPIDNYRFRFERGKHIGIGLDGGCFLGRIDLELDSYKDVKRMNNRSGAFAGLHFDIDDIVSNWKSQRDVFERRLEEECVRCIKQKAEIANANWKYARKELENAESWRRKNTNEP